jgi:hypothetical protein
MPADEFYPIEKVMPQVPVDKEVAMRMTWMGGCGWGWGAMAVAECGWARHAGGRGPRLGWEAYALRVLGGVENGPVQSESVAAWLSQPALNWGQGAAR